MEALWIGALNCASQSLPSARGGGPPRGGGAGAVRSLAARLTLSRCRAQQSMSSVSDQTLALMRRMPTDRVSVLVVGDQGVGKTSLVRCLCSEVDGKANSIVLAPVRAVCGSCHSCLPRWLYSRLDADPRSDLAGCGWRVYRRADQQQV